MYANFVAIDEDTTAFPEETFVIAVGAHQDHLLDTQFVT